MKFSEMAPEQFEYWMTEIRPLIVQWQERQAVLNREAALRIIRRPARRPSLTATDNKPGA